MIRVSLVSHVVANLFSRSAQLAMGIMTWVDRHWGTALVSLDPDRDSTGPYERLLTLRKTGNVHRVYTINGWIVLDHAGVRALLRDKRISSEVTNSRVLGMVIRSAARGLAVPMLDNPNMLNRDAPDHTRLRRLSSQSFTNRFIQSLGPAIGNLVDELLETIPTDADQFDVMETLAKPLPAIVIAEMLGAPIEERHLFEKWSAELLKFGDILDPAALQSAVEGDVAMRVYLEQLAEFKRDNPGDDLITRMIEAEAQGDKLSLDELYSTCTLILVAGHETTTRLIGSCLYLLLTHPDQMERVKQDRSLLKGAIEESLRFESPVLVVSRIVKESFVFDGHKFRKGQMVMLSLAGANRDPEVFSEPESFLIDRSELEHVSFGYGIHLCLGMPLARLEAELALNKLLDRYPNMQLVTEDVTWEANPFFRGLERLDIKCT